DAGALRKQIDGCYRHAIGPGRKPAVARDGARKLKALVVPHAGYVYSGPVAAHAYAALAEDGLPETFVVLGPNHTGMGAAVVLASTDFSHYIPKAEAARRDRMAIDKILASDVKGFYRTIKEQDVSMCGFGPVMAMMTAIGPAKPELLKYASSGDVAPMDDVVGYGAIAMRR